MSPARGGSAAMGPNSKAAVVGLGAAALALAICGLLTLIYVEWVWFADDANLHAPTNALLVSWALVPLVAVYGLARVFEVKPWLPALVAIVVLVPMAFVGAIALSHNNACFGGESYPVPDQWSLWGRECGR